MIGIYGIFRRSDDKCMYVGQSKDINGRIKSHLTGHTKNSFNKDEYYGEMIEEHMINDKAFRLEREAYWIDQLNPELNVIRDETKRGEYFLGENGPMYGRNCEDYMTLEAIKVKRKRQSEAIKGEKHPMYGKHRSEETKKKISEHTDNRGVKNPCYGTKWINDGIITKKVKQEELDKYIQDGWKLGRLPWKRNS